MLDLFDDFISLFIAQLEYNFEPKNCYCAFVPNKTIYRQHKVEEKKTNKKNVRLATREKNSTRIVELSLCISMSSLRHFQRQRNKTNLEKKMQKKFFTSLLDQLFFSSKTTTITNRHFKYTYLYSYEPLQLIQYQIYYSQNLMPSRLPCLYSVIFSLKWYRRTLLFWKIKTDHLHPETAFLSRKTIHAVLGLLQMIYSYHLLTF